MLHTSEVNEFNSDFSHLTDFRQRLNSKKKAPQQLLQGTIGKTFLFINLRIMARYGVRKGSRLRWPPQCLCIF